MLAFVVKESELMSMHRGSGAVNGNLQCLAELKGGVREICSVEGCLYRFGVPQMGQHWDDINGLA